MADTVRTKLNQLDSQYSANVKETRRLTAERRNGGAGVSDAEARRLNGLIDALNVERETIFAERNKLAKLEKTAKDYTSLQTKIKEKQLAIAKAEARGENTSQLKSDQKDLTDKFNSIAPGVEQAFPDIKAKPIKETKPGPLGNVQMSTGTAITDTTASKAAAAKKKVTTPAVDDQTKLPPKKTKVTSSPAFAQEDVVDTTTLEGIKKASARPVTGTKDATGKEDINAIYALAKSKYSNVDSIFLYDDELKKLLIEVVKDPATSEDDMEPDEFLRRVAASDWAIRNATTYAKRDAERRQYTETLDKYNQQLELADTQDKKDAILAKIGELKTTSSYARGLASAKAYIEATASGLTGTMDPARLDAFVKRMYDSANDKDPNIINRELAALISYKPGSQLGGAVGADLTILRATARANGFDLDTTFKDQINNWMQRLAVGESVETFKNTIRSQAKLGLPDKVGVLLDQGVDLDTIYSPYRRQMARLLEVDEDAISLDDPLLRSAIGPDKEQTLYDYKKMIRKDPRWQYTDNAKEEVSDIALQVLRDFGFQG